MRPVITPSDDDKPVDITPQTMAETYGFITGLEAQDYMKDPRIDEVTPEPLPDDWSQEEKDDWDKGYLHGRAVLGPEDNN